MANDEVSDEVLEQVEDAIYGLDAARLLTVMRSQSVSPDTCGSYLRNMPLIHIALDAEWTEATQGDGTYVPAYEVLRVLLDVGADQTIVYLGNNARGNALSSGLAGAVEILDQHASGPAL